MKWGCTRIKGLKSGPKIGLGLKSGPKIDFGLKSGPKIGLNFIVFKFKSTLKNPDSCLCLFRFKNLKINPPYYLVLV